VIRTAPIAREGDGWAGRRRGGAVVGRSPRNRLL